MSERPKSSLTPAQSADVIRYYHDGENQETRKSGQRNRVALGEAALRTTMWRHSITPDSEGLLTLAEMQAGLRHIEHPPDAHPPSPYYFDLERIVDAHDTSPQLLDAERATPSSADVQPLI
jgi:hypothetical protein